MLKNNANFDYYNLSYLFHKDKLININNSFKSIGISVDTRTIEKNNLFIALKGENQDGHSRVLEAFDKSASAAIINEEWYENNKENLKDKQLIIVKDTLKAIGSLAKEYRSRFNIPIIAIAGANGKTTTKEITSFILSKKYKVLKTFENFNNQLGLPIMLFQLDDSFQIAVLEIGTSEPGEIEKLSNILQPSSGLITNIGKEHLEKLIDIEGVELEETSLYGYLTINQGLAFVNYDDEKLSKYIRILPDYFTYGKDRNCKLSYSIEIDNELNTYLNLSYNNQETKVNLKIKGITNAQNAVAASAIALHYNFSLLEISQILEEYENTTNFSHSYGRMAVEQINSITLINDTYNSNPDSMLAAFNNISLIKGNKNKIAILADMKELGECSLNEHINILNKAQKYFDRIIIYGIEFKNAFLEIQDKINDNKIVYLENQDLIKEYLVNELQIKNLPFTILVKGSRSMKMENIVEFIKENCKNN